MLRRSSFITPKVLFFLLIITTTYFEIGYCTTINDHHGVDQIMCPEIEKQALLSFKHSLEDSYGQLSSWNDEVNCCMWKGVVCNNSTGNVHELHLRGYHDEAASEIHGLRGKINSSLLNLKYLNYLDMSLNDFGGRIPSFIGSFANMESLSLIDAGFHGVIPHTIASLSNLRYLNLQSEFAGIYSDNLDWLSGLSRLEQLNMKSVDLSKATNWLHVLNTLPSLSELRLQGCNLDLLTPIDSVNFSSLHTLDLSENYISSFGFPRWTLQLKELTFLDLSENSIEGPIPSTSNSTKLEHIDLSYNRLNSTIPDWLYSCNKLEFVNLCFNSLLGTISDGVSNLSSLRVLDLSMNNLYGSVPPGVLRSCKMHHLDLSSNNLQGEIVSDIFGNMSDCFLGSLEFLLLNDNQFFGQISNGFGKFKNLRSLGLGENSITGTIPFVLGELSALEYLSLESNKFVGNLPETLGKLSNLKYLDVGWNSITGAIPFVLGELSSLEYLYLGSNKFVGNLPETLGKLSNLKYLHVSNNSLEGVLTESHFINLKNLDSFYASGNQLTFQVSPNWIPPFQLSDLRLQSTNINGPFPSWLETQKNLEFLNLSNSGIHGLVPMWVWNISIVDLSNNNLYGHIPSDISSEVIILKSNQFNGSMPRVAKNVAVLDLSNNSISGGISNVICDNMTEPYALQVLHLGGNQLSGELPHCWMRLKDLQVLNLGDNDMNGTIPSSITALEQLQILNLRNNRFSGHVPPLITPELVIIDLSGNYFYGNLPKWTKLSSGSPRFIILRSNKLSGRIDSSICSFTSIQILDISNNNLYGTIPSCFHNFTAMIQNINLASYDQKHEHTASVIIIAKGQPRSYDVLLPFVTSIDLANNNLSGKIPPEFTRLLSLRMLNLSRNHLTGSIPRDIGDMKQLECLDLSFNSLIGEIPISFTMLSFLNDLNLSYNNLTGIIPESTQLQSMNASSFVGNNLCGPPLIASKSGVKDDDDDDKIVLSHGVEVDWFVVLLSLGYAIGLSSFYVVMISHRLLRVAYFGMLEDIWERIRSSSSLKRYR